MNELPPQKKDLAPSKGKFELPWWAMAIIATALGVVAGQVMMTLGVSSEQTASFPAEGSGGSRYPELLRNSFMEGCVGSAEGEWGKTDAKQICNCMVEKLEAAYSLEDFISIVSRIQGEGLPPKLQMLLADCVKDSNDD